MGRFSPHSPAASAASMNLRCAVYLDHPLAACFLMQKVDILRYNGLKSALFFKSSQYAVHDRRLFFVEIIDKIPGRRIIKRRIFVEYFYIEDLFGVDILVEPILAAEVPDARKGTDTRSSEGYAISRLFDQALERLEFSSRGLVISITHINKYTCKWLSCQRFEQKSAMTCALSYFDIFFS